jgi:hypothetical protein
MNAESSSRTTWQLSVRPMRRLTMQTYGGHMERNQDSILYIETDIPPQMTCSDWRRSKIHGSRRGLFSRLRARRAAAAAAALRTS